MCNRSPTHSNSSAASTGSATTAANHNWDASAHAGKEHENWATAGAVVTHGKVCHEQQRAAQRPQFASLRIPNRVRPPQVVEVDEDDPGLDLEDAEVESVGGEGGSKEFGGIPVPAPRQAMNVQHPLRAAHSVEAMQVSHFMSVDLLDSLEGWLP